MLLEDMEQREKEEEKEEFCLIMGKESGSIDSPISGELLHTHGITACEQVYLGNSRPKVVGEKIAMVREEKENKELQKNRN